MDLLPGRGVPELLHLRKTVALHGFACVNWGTIVAGFVSCGPPGTRNWNPCYILGSPGLQIAASSAFWAPGVEKVQPVMHCSPTGPRQCNLWVQRGIVAACVVCEHANNSRVTVMWSQWRCSNSRLLG